MITTPFVFCVVFSLVNLSVTKGNQSPQSVVPNVSWNAYMRSLLVAAIVINKSGYKNPKHVPEFFCRGKEVYQNE